MSLRLGEALGVRRLLLRYAILDPRYLILD
jgi:hypothetical protein